ncbi:MAG: hypothetical protein CNB20_01605 [Pelagibacterales bacterium MED-G43]|nr:MAG: hypothetical protein CNB20_01605 [Pelagibacterales bacterium MED-G43]|tara:strand:- start:122 stop:460 length:339 start_codon:yes stop_codon:yes gene_type:complete
MFKKKFIISTIVFIIFLLITSAIKNQTRIIEKNISSLNTKILAKKKNINEAQMDFYYLTSPAEIEKRLNLIGFDNYKPIKLSNIFFEISEFYKIQNKTTNLKKLDEKKIKKK